MIEIKNLSKSYTSKGKAIPVLRGVNLTITRGEIFGIIGKSGAGKSTLLRCINLLENFDDGQILVDEVDLSQLNAKELRLKRQEIGMIFQGFNLLESKTVFANIALPLILQKKHSQEVIREKVTKLLELVGLGGLENKHPSELSGGQKQRVGIARAISTNPKILLSDEATSALDQETTNSILELLMNINKELGITIVLITHELDVIRKVCDKVAVIDNGQIIETGEVVKVILHPKERLTRKLIIEEETHKYLEKVRGFYHFHQNADNLLLLISFIGNKTFTPILNSVTVGANVVCNILRGELGYIKNMPFGQLLVEINGDSTQLNKALALLKNLEIDYEVVSEEAIS